MSTVGKQTLLSFVIGGVTAGASDLIAAFLIRAGEFRLESQNIREYAAIFTVESRSVGEFLVHLMKPYHTLVVVTLLLLPCLSTLSAQTKPWLKADKVAEGVWRIDDNASDNMYLIVGTQRALLIDTGVGVADLSAFIKTVTNKPLLVINTHGHPDHAGGNFQFQTVYADAADFDLIRQITPGQARRYFPNLTRDKNRYSGLAPTEQTALGAKLVAVKDGFFFDLGGRRIEVIETPGHTPGEIVLLDATHNQVFTGDNDNRLVWLFLSHSLPLETYLDSLKKLNARSAEFSMIYPGHGPPLPNTFVAEQIGCVQAILSGSLPSELYHSFVGDARVSRFKTAEVAFDPGNLWLKK